MATDTPAEGHHDKHDVGKAKSAKVAHAPPSPGGKPKPDKHDAAGKKRKPGKNKRAGHKVAARSGFVGRVRATANAVADAAATPRGVAVSTVVATVGLVAGLVALTGPRRAGAIKPVKDRPSAVKPDVVGAPAETIGAIMAKAAEHDTTA